MTNGRVVVAALLALAGCDSGFGFDVTVDGNCAAQADQVTINVELTPSGGKMETVPAAQFFEADGTGRVVVVPPQGTTHIKVTLQAMRGGAAMATAVAETDVGAHQIVNATVSLAGCGGDSGVPRDMAVPADLIFADVAVMPDLQKMPDLMTPVDFVMPADMADCRQHMPDCANGQKCSPANGACVQCLADGDCVLGFVCDLNQHKCVSGCNQNHGCPNMNQPCINGMCGCNVNGDCGGNGALCCNNACIDGTTNLNCGSCGHKCINNTTCCGNACLDLTTDPSNCGSCGHLCKVANGVGDCSNSACFIASCNPMFDDCYNGYADGCETRLSNDVNNCGVCGHVCNLPNATPSCVAGSCAIASCNMGFADCNMFPDDGCEAFPSNDIFNCGACGHVCMLANAGQACVGGKCFINGCDFGWDNCDGLNDNGCEKDVTSDPNNCGACGMKCGPVMNGTPGCSGGSCFPNCSVGFADCDGNYNTGCETNIYTDPNNCGGCGNVCGGGDTCMMGVCVGGGFDMGGMDGPMDMPPPSCGPPTGCTTYKDPISGNDFIVCSGKIPPRISATATGGPYYVNAICACLGYGAAMMITTDDGKVCGGNCAMPGPPSNTPSFSCNMTMNGPACSAFNNKLMDWACGPPLQQ